jgi:hypothetical protein
MTTRNDLWRFRGVIFIGMLLWGAASHAGCRVPSYRVAQVNRDAAPDVFMDISIRQEDFAPESLVCLAFVLRQKYRQAPQILVGIFDSYAAAANYRPLAVEYTTDLVRWASRQHAIYHYNPENHEEYLLLLPDGLSLSRDSPLMTRIDLPTTGPPSCKLQIRGRCLLVFDHIGATEKDGFGTVVLTARMEKNGKVSDVRLAESETVAVTPERLALIQFATRNLRSWRFQDGKAAETFRITFSLEHVDTPLGVDGIDVQLQLPDRVNIKLALIKM